MRILRRSLPIVLRCLIITAILFQQIAIPLDALAAPSMGGTASLKRNQGESLDDYLERVALAQPELFQQAAMIAIQDAFNGKLPEKPGDQALEEQIAHYLTQAAEGDALAPPQPTVDTSSSVEGDTYHWRTSQTDASGAVGSDWQLTARPGGAPYTFGETFEALMPTEALPAGLFDAPDVDVSATSSPVISPVITPVITTDADTSDLGNLDRDVPTLLTELLPISIDATPVLADAPAQEIVQGDQTLMEQAQFEAVIERKLIEASLATQSLQFASGLETTLQASADELAMRTTSTAQADLGVHISAPATATFATVITYTITITNFGPSPATNVQISQTLPANGVYTPTIPGCSSAGGKVTCGVGNLAVSGSRTLTVPVAMKGNGVVTSTVRAVDMGGTVDPGGQPATAAVSVTVASETRTQFEVGKIVVAANNFVTVTSQVRASGAVEIGFKDASDNVTFHLKLGPEDIVTWSVGGETLNGAGALNQIKEDFSLFNGPFTADGSQDEPLLVPSPAFTPTITELGGFSLVGSAVITQVAVSSGNATVSATIEFSQPGVTTDTQKALVGTIKPGGKVEGEIDKFSMVFAGVKIEVAKATMREDEIVVKNAKLTMPDKFGKLTGILSEMKIKANSISLGGAGVKIPIPNIYPVGSPVTTTVTVTPTSGITGTTPTTQTVTVTPTVAIVKNSATVGYFNGKYGLQLEGTLQLWLPDNHRDIPIEFKIDEKGDLQASVKEIRLTIAGQELVMRKVELSNQGLKVDEASLTIQTAGDKTKKPTTTNTATNTATNIATSLDNGQSSVAADEKAKPDKKLTVIVKKVVIDKDGIKIGGAGVTNYLPDIPIGEVATFTKLEFTVVVNNPTANATLELAIKGLLKVKVSNNDQEVKFTAKMDKEGKFSGKIDAFSLTIAKSQLELAEIEIDGNGFAAKSATLTLPDVLNKTKATVNGVKFDEKGISFGDAGVAIPITLTIGKPEDSNNIGLKGNLSLILAQDRTYGFAFEGDITIKVASQTAAATGAIRLDDAGTVRGTVNSFSLTIAGMNLAIKSANIEGGVLLANEATLSIPQEWGGLSTSVYQVKISNSDFSIGGGAFKLPEVKVGDMVLSLEGKLKKEEGGYAIAAGGLLKMPNLGGAGCSGLAVSVEIFANTGSSTSQATSQNMVMVISPMSAVEAQAFSMQLREISVSLQCTIPIGTSGFELTSVSGKLTLSNNSTRIELKVTIESQLRIASVKALTGEGDMALEYVKNPYKFEIGLGASMKVFSMFEAARARATMRFTDGDVPFLFKAEMNIDAVIAKGEVKLTAWTKDGSFHLTGRIYGQIGVRQGAITNSCWTIYVPYYNSWRDFGVRRSEVCLRIPPSDLFFSATMEFGEFKREGGTIWGFKGAVEILGKNYGVYVDANGNFSVTNVDQYKLIDTPSIQRARALQQMIVAGQTVQSALSAEDIDLATSYHFADEQIVIDIANITTPGDLGVSILRSETDADVVITLIRPDGLEISGINPPSNVTFREDFLSFSNITDADTGLPIAEGDVLPMLETYMNVTNAAFGPWRIRLDREPTNEFIINVDGTVYGPPIEKLVLGEQENLNNVVDLAWTQTAEVTSTVTIYATQGAMTTTASYTATESVNDGVGIMATQVVTRDLGVVTQFTGLPVASFTYLPGKQLITEEVNLSSLRSGVYNLWLEVDDGLNPPNRRYFPGTATVWQEWQDTWDANVQVQAIQGGLTVTWDANPNPDAEGYEIEVTEAGADTDVDTFVLDVGQSLSQTVTGLVAPADYTITVVAYNTGTGNTAYAESVSGTPLAAPFAFSAEPTAVAMNGGAAANVTLKVASPLTSYPDWVFLAVDEIPAGLDWTLYSEIVTPTVEGVQTGLVITAEDTLPSGVYIVTVLAASSGDIKQVEIPVTVQEPTFALQASANALTLFKGSTATVDINATYQFGEQDTIDVDLEEIPPGIDWAFDADGFAPGGKVTLTVGDTGYLAFGNYEVVIYGTDYVNAQTLTLPLTLAGFEVFSDWDSVNAEEGETVSYVVELDGAAWPDAVAFGFDTASLGEHFAVTIDNSTVNVPATVNPQVTVLPDTPPGVYELTLLATSLGVTETLPLYLTVQDNPAATDLQMGYATDFVDGVIIAGESYSYVLSPRNISANAAPDVTVIDVTHDTAYLTLLDGDNCSSNTITDTTTLTCGLGTIQEDDENRDTTITWQVAADTPDGTLIVHKGEAMASMAVSETSTLDNLADLAFEVVRLADLRVDADASPARAGDRLNYTATVVNDGPSVADDVVVEIFLPTGVSLHSTTATCSQAAELIRCAAGNLAVGDTTTVTATVVIVPDQRDELETFIATFSASDDPDFDNNAAYLLSEIDALATLAIDITPSLTETVEGETMNYLLTVHNQGPSQATDVDIALALPEFVDVRDIQIGTVTGSPDALVIDAGQTLTISISALFLEDSGGEPLPFEVEVSAAEADLVVQTDMTVMVHNANPTAVFSGTMTVNEGEWGILSVRIDDAGANFDPLTIAWDLDNDGDFGDEGFGDGDMASIPFDARHIDGPATRPVAVRVADDEGGLVEISGTVTIANFAPQVDAGQDQSQPFDQPFILDFDYVDTYGGDSHTAQVDWGDGTTDELTLPATNAVQVSTLEAQIDHVYNQVGQFNVNVCVTDSNGGTGCDQLAAVAACREHGLTARFDHLGREVRIVLFNASGQVALPSDFPLTLYNGNTPLQTFTLERELAVGASTKLTYVWPQGAPSSYHLRLATDDDGNGTKRTPYCSGTVERHVSPRQERQQIYLPHVKNNPYRPLDKEIYLPSMHS